MRSSDLTPPSNFSFVEYKEIIRRMKRYKNEFKQIGHESQLDDKLIQQVEENLDKEAIKYQLQHEEFTEQLTQEIKEAECTKRWDILKISSSLVCCIPSYVLTCCHLCACLVAYDPGIFNSLHPILRCEAGPGLGECGDIGMVDCCRGPGLTCRDDSVYRKLSSNLCGFFCRPVNTINESILDYREQSEKVENYKLIGPRRQQME